MNRTLLLVVIVGLAMLATVPPAPETTRSDTYMYHYYLCGRYGSHFLIVYWSAILKFSETMVTQYTVSEYNEIYVVSLQHIEYEGWTFEIELPTDGERIYLEQSFMYVCKGNSPYFMPTDWRNVLQNISGTLEEFRENGTISGYHASAGELDGGIFYNITVIAPARSWIGKNGTGEIHFYVKTKGNRTIYLVFFIRLQEHNYVVEMIQSAEKQWFMEREEIVSNTAEALLNISESSVVVREFAYEEYHAGELERIFYCTEDWNFTDIDMDNRVCNASCFSLNEVTGWFTYNLDTIKVSLYVWEHDSLTVMAPFTGGVTAPVLTVPNWCENELSLLYTMNVSVANYTEFRRIYYGHYAVHIKGGPVSVQNASDSERYLVGDFDLNDEIRYDANTGILQNHTSTFNMYFVDGTTTSVLRYRGTEPYRIGEEEKGYDMTVIWIVSAVVVIAVAGAIIMYKKHVIRL